MVEESKGMSYIHGQWSYFVDQRNDNGKFTAFMSSTDPTAEGMKAEVATIPDFDTFEEAQNALDGYALKHKFAAECSTPDQEPEMEQQTIGDTPEDNGETVPDSDTPPEVEQKDGEAEQNGSYPDENPDFDNDSGDSANDSPCDWKNASGDDDQDPEDVESTDPLPDGPDLSLRLSAFDPVFDTADDTLRDMARTLKTKFIESGELTIKVVLNNFNGTLKPDPKKCKVDCALKPAKVSTSVRLSSDLEIAVEQDGRVIIPEDREQQLSFDQAAPSGKATVDGNTGLVEGYQEDEAENPQNDPEGKPVSCENIDCPYYSGDGCGFIPDADGPINMFDLQEAVEQFRCTNSNVLNEFNTLQATEDSSFESSGEGFSDDDSEKGDDEE